MDNDGAVLGIVFLVLVVLGLVLYLVTERLRQVQEVRQLREKSRLEHQAHKALRRSENIGNRIYNALVKAAEDHPGFSERLRYAEVLKMPDNAGRYSVIVRYQEPGVASHELATFMVNVPLEAGPDEEIHVLEGNYGPNSYYEMDEVSVVDLIERLKEKTRSWGLPSEATT